VIDITVRRLVIFAPDQRREIDFTQGLNVIVGPYGSGKTSLLELIKYGLGGTARLSDAVKDGVTSIALEVNLGGTTYLLDRDIGSHDTRVSLGSDPVATLHDTSSKATGKQLALTSSWTLSTCRPFSYGVRPPQHHGRQKPFRSGICTGTSL
jgi:DNA repair exonuclease SbcCD ATPase subunit